MAKKANKANGDALNPKTDEELAASTQNEVAETRKRKRAEKKAGGPKGPNVDKTTDPEMKRKADIVPDQMDNQRGELAFALHACEEGLGQVATATHDGWDKAGELLYNLRQTFAVYEMEKDDAGEMVWKLDAHGNRVQKMSQGDNPRPVFNHKDYGAFLKANGFDKGLFSNDNTRSAAIWFHENRAMMQDDPDFAGALKNSHPVHIQAAYSRLKKELEANEANRQRILAGGEDAETAETDDGERTPEGGGSGAALTDASVWQWPTLNVTTVKQGHQRLERLKKIAIKKMEKTADELEAAQQEIAILKAQVQYYAGLLKGAKIEVPTYDFAVNEDTKVTVKPPKVTRNKLPAGVILIAADRAERRADAQKALPAPTNGEDTEHEGEPLDGEVLPPEGDDGMEAGDQL